jgi:hypothetical protein
MIKSFVALVATSALAMKLVQHLGRQHHQRRTHQDGLRQREDVSRWEEEGGNLPPAKPATRASAKRRATRR